MKKTKRNDGDGGRVLVGLGLSIHVRVLAYCLRTKNNCHRYW